MQDSSAFQFIASDQIHESTTNPRQTFDQIREQVAKGNRDHSPSEDASGSRVNPTVIKIVEHRSATKKDGAVHIVEFDPINRERFKEG